MAPRPAFIELLGLNCKGNIQKSNQNTQRAFLLPSSLFFCLTTTALPHSHNIPIMPHLCGSHYLSLSHFVAPHWLPDWVCDWFQVCNCSVLPPVELNFTATLMNFDSCVCFQFARILLSSISLKHDVGRCERCSIFYCKLLCLLKQ